MRTKIHRAPFGMGRADNDLEYFSTIVYDLLPKGSGTARYWANQFRKVALNSQNAGSVQCSSVTRDASCENRFVERGTRLVFSTDLMASLGQGGLGRLEGHRSHC